MGTLVNSGRSILSRLKNYFNSPSAGNVFRRQMLTYKDGPCADRVNPLAAKLFNLYFHPLEVVSR